MSDTPPWKKTRGRARPKKRETELPDCNLRSRQEIEWETLNLRDNVGIPSNYRRWNRGNKRFQTALRSGKKRGKRSYEGEQQYLLAKEQHELLKREREKKELEEALETSRIQEDQEEEQPEHDSVESLPDWSPARSPS